MNGVLVPIAGQVCMDQVLLDVTDAPYFRSALFSQRVTHRWISSLASLSDTGARFSVTIKTVFRTMTASSTGYAAGRADIPEDIPGLAKYTKSFKRVWTFSEEYAILNTPKRNRTYSFANHI